MCLAREWTVHSWELLQTRGWWFAVGLILSVFVQIIPAKGEDNRKKSIPFWQIIWGALLPVCNFAVVPLAVVLWNKGMGTGAVVAFLSAAVLVNPSAVLSAWAYMGPELTVAWVFGAVVVSLAVGMAGTVYLQPAEGMKPNPQQKNTSAYAYLGPVPDVARWLVLGIMVQSLLQVLMPENLWNQLLLDAKGTSFGQAAAVGLFRHVCIPDDVALAASLVATGLRPGFAVLFLLLGICTNLPELFVLYGVVGKKTVAVYLGVTAAVSVAAALLTELVLGIGFVPHFNLANAETYTRIANLLTIRTWMPARIPCAIVMLLLAGMGLWHRRNNNLFFGLVDYERTENKRKN